MKPAWSWQFEEGALPPAPQLALDGPITSEWAWEGATGRDVKVAIVDSGVEDGHPLVGHVNGAVALEFDPDAADGVRVVEGPHQDVFGHGTACAAIIRSIAPECEIHSVRVLGERLTGKGFIFGAGVRWAVEHGMQVVNLSLSTRSKLYYSMFHELGDLAYFRRTILVAAINNVRGASYPAEFSSVFSVASNDERDPFRFEFNPNGPVEFGAPGIDLEVAWLGGTTIHATGNSFATPHIAGVVTLLLSKHPELTPFQVKTVLAALARNAPRP